MKSSSRCSLVHLLPTSSSKNAPPPPPPSVCVTILVWNRSLATVLRTFFRPHLPKTDRTWQLLTILHEIELSLQSRTHFVDLIFPAASCSSSCRKLVKLGGASAELGKSLVKLMLEWRWTHVVLWQDGTDFDLETWCGCQWCIPSQLDWIRTAKLLGMAWALPKPAHDLQTAMTNDLHPLYLDSKAVLLGHQKAEGI